MFASLPTHTSEKNSWTRATIEDIVRDWIETTGDLKERDLTSLNNLPSLLTVLRHFPECPTLNSFKARFNCAPNYRQWTIESAVEAGKSFVANSGGKLKAVDLSAGNQLPTISTVHRLFGSLRAYQEKVGAEQWKKNRRVSDVDIDMALEEIFHGSERIIDCKSSFFLDFRFGRTVIRRMFGSVEEFFERKGIVVRS